MRVCGIYRDGKVVLDEPVDWPEETHVEVVVEEETSMDGTPWPRTKEEMERWCQEIMEAPPVFEDPEELAQFEKFLAESKAEQKELERANWDKIDDLL